MAKITRAELAQLDLEALMLDEKFLRTLSTFRMIAGIETVAYGPESRHLHFVEGRRSLWCDILRTVEKVSDDALLRILTEEMKTLKETSDGRRKYNRLDTDPDGDPSGRPKPEPGVSDVGQWLDYGQPEPPAGA